jgi:hypothetical protein
MSKTMRWLLPVLALACSGTALAQTAEQKFYKMEFVVKEVEAGKTVNTRAFTTMLGVAPNSKATIRTGGRVAVPNPPGQNIFLDLGVNIDCSDLRETGSDLWLSVTADVSTLFPDSPQPMVRSNRWSGTVILPAKKPTVLFSSDDVASKRQIQLELTATPIK